jgi:hypothetical protein
MVEGLGLVSAMSGWRPTAFGLIVGWPLGRAAGRLAHLGWLKTHAIWLKNQTRRLQNTAVVQEAERILREDNS